MVTSDSTAKDGLCPAAGCGNNAAAQAKYMEGLAGCPACLLNIAKRSLPKLILRGVGLASNDAVG